MALAFVLVNVWVYLLWFFVSWAQPGESIPAEAKAGIVDYWIVDVNTR